MTDYQRGERDASKAIGNLPLENSLRKTCFDVMPDGNYRHVQDAYWHGVLNSIGPYFT